MPYARFDDRYDDHRKIKRALRREPAAVAIHAMAITYCNRHNTNGALEMDTIEEWLALLPYKPRQKQRVLAVLFDLCLLEKIDTETLAVHDFLDWNLSREQRAALAEQGRRGGHARSGSSPPGNGGSSHRPSQGLGQGLGEGSSGGSSTPTPTPTPTPSQAEHLSANADSPAAAPQVWQGERLDERVAFLCHLMSSEVRAAHGIAESSSVGLVVKAWHDACRSLLTRDGYTFEQVEFAVRWVCRHHYWSKRVRSMPRLRTEMEQVVKEVREQRSRGNVVALNRKPTAGDLIRKLRENEAS